MGIDESAIGTVGRLTVATRGELGPGEVLLPIRGGTETYLAYSEQPLDRGTQVLVVEAHGTRRVTVIAWTDPAEIVDL